MKVWVVLVRGMAFLAGCTSNETNDNEKRGPANEETRFVTQIVTVEETTVVTEAPRVAQEQPPEDVLALQYEYINGGDYEEAYLLCAEQSRREVSLEQYRAFFENNAPYSVTDYSFSPGEMQDNLASVEAKFTVTSASGVERLERTQEFVCERGEWRVVMRPEQVAVFTAEDDDADTDSTRDPVTSTGDLDCDDFEYQKDAQAAYEQDTSDPNGLDGRRRLHGRAGGGVRGVTEPCQCPISSPKKPKPAVSTCDGADA
jgi:hypothetical protein